MNAIVGRILHDSKKKKSPSTSPKISRRRHEITVLQETVVLSKFSPRDTVPIQQEPHPKDTTETFDSGDERDMEDIEAAGARYLRQMSAARRPTVTEIVTGNETQDDDTDLVYYED
ncbi:Hypp516 [Branchiostoma lanceolatum]|uniref:Hypp516 protein n=1 Tax=Branchiostoma lanceolatum TaxID=7740 RepID=A0A8J9W4I1_BRALA|nr:Hypp516 [Branchiostoma lanceolatum]